MAIGPMTEAERYRFDLHGFLVRRGVLGRGELAALHAAIDVLDLPRPRDLAASASTTTCRSPAASATSSTTPPCWRSSARSAARTCASTTLTASSCRPAPSGLGLHGGGTPFDPAQYYLVDGGRIRSGLIAAQSALVDHPPGAGGFVCIPGSHKAGFGLPATFDPDLAVQVPIAAGDVIVFSEALTHGTLPWQSAQERRTLVYKYSPGNSAWSHAVWPPDLLAACTDRQRLLLQPPSVGYHRPVAP